MCISCFAAYLNPFHPVGKIRFFHHQALVYRLGETRPSATRIKLIGRDKQRFPGRDIYVDAFTLFIPIFILESSFRSVLLCYRILLGGATGAEPRFGDELLNSCFGQVDPSFTLPTEIARAFPPATYFCLFRSLVPAPVRCAR